MPVPVPPGGCRVVLVLCLYTLDDMARRRPASHSRYMTCLLPPARPANFSQKATPKQHTHTHGPFFLRSSRHRPPDQRTDSLAAGRISFNASGPPALVCAFLLFYVAICWCRPSLPPSPPASAPRLQVYCTVLHCTAPPPSAIDLSPEAGVFLERGAGLDNLILDAGPKSTNKLSVGPTGSDSVFFFFFWLSI